RISRPRRRGRLMGKRGASPAPPAGGSHDRLIDLTRRLAAVAAELGLSEIEVESAGTRLRVQRAGAAPAPVTHMVAAPATSGAGPTIEQGMVADVAAPTAITVEAPMVGTFYRASAPPVARSRSWSPSLSPWAPPPGGPWSARPRRIPPS